MANTDPLAAAETEAEQRERRRHARIKLPLKARFLDAAGAEHPCIVANISAGGALLRAKATPAESEQVVLYIDEVGRFEGRVVRSGKHTFAVDYRGRKAKSKRTADALTLTLHNRKDTDADRRTTPRIRQDTAAHVTLENGDVVACSILDISLTGASIQIEPKPPLGAVLTLGKMKAKVVRRHEQGVGVVFSGSAQKLDQAVKETRTATTPAVDGLSLAPSFGKKGDTA